MGTTKRAFRWVPCFFATAGVFFAESRVDAGLIVESWGLLVAVANETTQDYDIFESVQSPFVQSHSAALGSSSVSTSYDFAWSETGGTFLIQGNQQAEDNTTLHLRSLSDGQIDVFSSVDLLFTAEGSYTYDLPGGAMAVTYGLGLLDAQTGQPYFAQGGSDDSFLNGSASGTFVIDGQGILPAGRPAYIRYFMVLDTYDSTGLFATGSGYFHFTLQQVPEPSTLGLAILGTAFLLRRRAR